MPLYSYICQDCNKQWNALVVQSDRDKQVCADCQNPADRQGVNGFAVNSKVDTSTQKPYSPKEIDKVIGQESEDRWKSHEDRVRKRREGLDYELVDLDITPGSKFNPQEYLGDTRQKELAKMNAEAFQEHQKAKKEGS